MPPLTAPEHVSLPITLELTSVTVTCFKPSGKYYAEETIQVNAEVLNYAYCLPGKPPTLHRTVVTFTVTDAVRTRVYHYGIPGLVNKTWEGPIHLTAEDMVPTIIYIK